MENLNNQQVNTKPASAQLAGATDSKQLASASLAKEAREWVGSEKGQKAIAEAHAQAKLVCAQLAEAKAVTDEMDEIQRMNRMRGDLEYYSYWAGYVGLG